MRFHFDDRELRRACRMAARAGRSHSRDSGRGGSFGFSGVFGPSGPFGARGPFGPEGPFGPGGPFGSDGPRRGRRGRRMFDRNDLRLVLLRMISDQPRHGYDLIKALEELSGEQYSPSPGVIYPTLAMLADQGLIAEQASDDQRRAFAITDAGMAELDAEAEAVAEAMARLESLAERAHRHRAPSIERAAVNLFTAVSQRMASRDEEDGEDLALRIAELLDEAAQKIERL